MIAFCHYCPAKIDITMKTDKGVRKAIAVRLRVILQEEVKHYVTTKNNPIYLKVVTPTQLKRFEQRSKKMINALRIVIHKLDPDGDKQPGWYDVITMNDAPEPGRLKSYTTKAPM